MVPPAKPDIFMAEKDNALPYVITDAIFGLAVEIGELAGIVTLEDKTADTQPRGENQMSELNPFSIEDMLSAHKAMMAGQTEEAGRFRSEGIEYAKEQLANTAPPAIIVPKLMYDLLDWAETSEAHPLIKCCVFLYEFEFIHPFADGTSMMGRKWHMLILSRWKPLFARLPVEPLLLERRQEYHGILAKHDPATGSTFFIEFMLRAIRDALLEFLNTWQAEQAHDVPEQTAEQVTEQVKHLLTILGEETLSLKDIMARLQVKHRPTFRDKYLLPALSSGLVEMTIPGKPNSNRQRYRAVKNRPA